MFSKYCFSIQAALIKIDMWTGYMQLRAQVQRDFGTILQIL